MRGDWIASGLNPPAPLAGIAVLALAPLARQIELAVPLTMSSADRTARIKVSLARLDRNAVQCVGILGSGAMHEAAGVRHGSRGSARIGGEGGYGAGIDPALLALGPDMHRGHKA